MDLQLTGKKALVSGASMGIGRAIAKRLAQEGIIKESGGGWTAYSESFQQYLSRLEDTLTTESHMLWPKTEVSLRAALTAGLRHCYGDGWQSALADVDEAWQLQVVVDIVVLGGFYQVVDDGHGFIA